MRPVKYVPNALSLFRIFASASLLFCARRPLLFIIMYFIIGLSDVLDGRIARRYHVESRMGAKLDGLGDALFFVMAFVSVLFLMKLRFDLLKCLLTAGVAIALKLFVLFYTRVRFQEWNGMHTYLNKSLGSVLYFAVPVCVYLGEINYWLMLALTIAVSITAVEEIAILCTSREYSANHKGILVEMWLNRRKRRRNG